jgi:cysteine-rich repeat protein
MSLAGELRPRWAWGTRVIGGVVLLAGVASACTEVPSPAGYREYVPPGGSGGGGTSAVAGSMATSGSAGEADGGAPEGGAPVGTGGGASGGGASGNGGKGGQAGSGSGGGGGSAATTCGNGTKEEGEECDDGNQLDFDGCSSLCTSKCETCLNEFYGANDDYKALVDFYRNSTEAAIEGPALGQPRSKLAQSLARCIVKSECLFDNPLPEAGCFCGSVSNADCQAGLADGPCVKEFGEAAEGKDYATVSARLSNITLGVGWAVELTALEGSRGYCVAACKEKREVTPCERCVAGPDTGTEIPPVGCTACLLPGICSLELYQCAQEKCANGDMVPCLGNDPIVPDEIFLAGPCKDVPLASSSFPPTAAALACKVDRCKSECFAP